MTSAKTEAISAAGTATDNKLKDYTKTTSLVTYINQQTGKIKLGAIKNSSTIATKTDVSTAQTAATNAANTATDNKLKSYTKTADLTISLDGIRSSVTSAKTEAIAAAGTATDNKLKDYTKTTSLVSYINQQAGKIELTALKDNNTLATKDDVSLAKTGAINTANNYTNNAVKPASIIAEINNSGSAVSLNANKINLDADTLALWAQNIRMDGGKISWNCDDSQLTDTGSLHIKSFFSTGTFRVTGNSSAYLMLTNGTSENGTLPTSGRYCRVGQNGISSGYNYGNTSGRSYSANITGHTGSISLKEAGGTSGTYSADADYQLSITPRYVFFFKDGKKVGTFDYQGITTTGKKSREVKTEQFGRRLLYCYETPSPFFGDIGEGVIGEDGLAYINIDSVFAATISTSQYQVFLQAYGEGSIYIKEKHPGFFIVSGSPGLNFGWELKAKQADFDQLRLDDDSVYYDIPQSENYAEMGNNHINGLTEIRTVI